MKLSLLLKSVDVLSLKLEIPSALLGPGVWPGASLALLMVPPLSWWVVLEVFVSFWLLLWALSFQPWARTALALLTLSFRLRVDLDLLSFGPTGASVVLVIWLGSLGASVCLGFGPWVAFAFLLEPLWLSACVISVTSWLRYSETTWTTLGPQINSTFFWDPEDCRFGRMDSEDAIAVWEVLLYSSLVDISGPDVLMLTTGKVCQEQPLASPGSYGKTELPGSLQPITLRPTNPTRPTFSMCLG